MLAAQVLDSARAQLGVPYRFGGSEPARGFDCSGLVQYVFEAHHIDLPRTVDEQFGRGIRIAIQDVRAGDLVFFSTTGPGPTHVGIAIGNGEFIHAPATNGVVRIEHYDTPYWHDRLIGARRMF
jgi:cell wall-associated NlpC family hydrolase